MPSRYRGTFRLVLLSILALYFAAAARAQYPNYLLETGSPKFAVRDPFPNGFVNVANGNVHIEIPVVSTTAQRGGQSFVGNLVYDSNIWQYQNMGIYGYMWEPDNVTGTFGYTASASYGWRFIATGSEFSGNDGVTNSCYSSTYGTQYWYQQQNYRFYDLHGTIHRFPLYYETSNACHTAGATTTSGPALDASGSLMNLATNAYSGGMEPNQLIRPDGATVLVGYNYPYGVSGVWKDPNGNTMDRPGPSIYTYNASFVDTLNRTVMQVTEVTDSSGNPSFIYTPTSGGNNYFVYLDGSNSSVYTPGGTAWGTMSDLVSQISLPDGTSYSFTYNGSYGQMDSMTLPTGATISFVYYTFRDANYSTNSWISTVTRGSGTWTYTPSVLTPGTGNCLSGTLCNQVKVTKPSGDDTVYTFRLNNGAWNTVTQSYTGSASSGTLALTVQHDYDFTLSDPTVSGPAFTRMKNTTTTLPISSSVNLVKQSADVFDTFTYCYEETTCSHTGSRGNVNDHKDYAYDIGSPGGLMREQTFSYLHISNSSYIAPNIVNRVTDVQTMDSSGTTKVAETITSYDGSSLTSVTGITHHDDTNFGTGNTVRGNPTQVQQWTGGSSYLSTTNAYDTTGQMLKTTDPKGNQTLFSYTNNFYTGLCNQYGASFGAYTSPPSSNAFATQVTLPVSGNVIYGYNYTDSNPALKQDQNSKQTWQSFNDPLDRHTGTCMPGGGWTSQAFTSATQAGVSSSSASGTATSDSQGRPSSASLTSDPSGTITGSQTYDTSGRVQSVANPFRSSYEPTYGSTSYQYDGLNRVTQTTLQDGNIQHAYYGPDVTSSSAGGQGSQLCSSSGVGYPTLKKDPAGKKAQTWTDALGRVIEADEFFTTSSPYSTVATCYTYDALGNLTGVVQGSQTRSFTYDPLSRLTQEITPEAGTVSYSYTTSSALCAGNPKALCQITDARSITTTYTYDAENRLTGKTYSDSTPSVSYSYDSTSTTNCTTGLSNNYGKGRRTGMSDGSGSSAWCYDADGNIVTENRTSNGVTEKISYTYTVNDTVSQMTYPSGMLVGNMYDGAGRLQSRYITSPTGFYFAYNATYAPQGALAGVTINCGYTYFACPGGVTMAYTYNNRLQPVNMTATPYGGSAVLNQSYSFVPTGSSANNGNVMSVANSIVAGRSQSYTYDEVNRLLTAQSSATSGADCWGQSYTYDRWANLTGISSTQCSAPALSLSVNGNNQITNTGYSYDAAGDLTADGTYTYTWNAEGRMKSVAGVNYIYDGDGKRVEKDNGKLYWYGLSGEVLAESDLSGNISLEYFYFNGTRIAKRVPSSGAVYSFLGDRLGSARVITDSSGNVVDESVYYPYGGEMVITGSSSDNNYKFTGYERDSESGLDHADNRQYASTTGRWHSPDPAKGRSSHPQSWNRYAYGEGNPVNLVDPSGGTVHCAWEVDHRECWDDELDGGPEDPPSESLVGQGCLSGTGMGFQPCTAAEESEWETWATGGASPSSGSLPELTCESGEVLNMDMYLAAHKAGSPLINIMAQLVSYSDESNIDDRFIIALAGQETCYGTCTTRGNNNYWNNGKKNPSSPEAAMTSVVNLLTGSKYFGSGAIAVDDIYRKYDPPEANANYPAELDSLNSIYFGQLQGGNPNPGTDLDTVNFSRCPAGT